MTIEKTNTNKSVVELRKELASNNTTVENVYVDGKLFTTIGYVSERDKDACLKAIQTAVDSSDNLYEAMQKLMINAKLTDNKIEPDEEIQVNGVTMFINYADKAIYDQNGEELVNCKELECDLPPEACKTILMQKLELAAQEDDDRYYGDEYL